MTLPIESIGVDCMQSLERTGASERHSRAENGEEGRNNFLFPILRAAVSRVVAHLARSSISMAKRKERDCVQSSRGADGRTVLPTPYHLSQWYRDTKARFKRVKQAQTQTQTQATGSHGEICEASASARQWKLFHSLRLLLRLLYTCEPGLY